MFTNNALDNPDLQNQGDLLVGKGSGNRPAILSVGTNSYVLTADNAQSLGVKWAPSTSGSLTWNNKTTNFNAVVANGYFVNGPIGGITATMPASPSNGDTIQFIVMSGFNTIVQANTGQRFSINGQMSSLAGTITNDGHGTITLVFQSSTSFWVMSNIFQAWPPT